MNNSTAACYAFDSTSWSNDSDSLPSIRSQHSIVSYSGKALQKLSVVLCICNCAGRLYAIGGQRCHDQLSDCPSAKTVESHIDYWSMIEGVELEVQSTAFSSSPVAALQRILPVSFKRKANDTFFQPLRSGIYLMSDSTIQYYDPDVSDTRWGLSTEIQNLLAIEGADAMLANEAAVMTCGGVDCFW